MVISSFLVIIPSLMTSPRRHHHPILILTHSHPIRRQSRPCCTAYFCLFASTTMDNHGLKMKPNAPATRLGAKGKQVQQRNTAQHIVEPAGLADTYNVDDVIAERMAKNDKGNSET